MKKSLLKQLIKLCIMLKKIIKLNLDYTEIVDNIKSALKLYIQGNSVVSNKIIKLAIQNMYDYYDPLDEEELEDLKTFTTNHINLFKLALNEFLDKL